MMTHIAQRLYEQLLVLRCQTGDRVALTELIAQYSPRLRFFLKKLAGESAADDLMQDVWTDAFARLNGLRDPRAFSAWIYRIARDKAYGQLRRRNRWVPIEEADNVAERVEDEVWSAEEIQLLRKSIDGLAAEYREVLLLRFVGEMNYQQIAEVIARPIGTVRSRIHYAKLALLRSLDKTSQ